MKALRLKPAAVAAVVMLTPEGINKPVLGARMRYEYGTKVSNTSTTNYNCVNRNFVRFWSRKFISGKCPEFISRSTIPSWTSYPAHSWAGGQPQVARCSGRRLTFIGNRAKNEKNATNRTRVMNPFLPTCRQKSSRILIVRTAHRGPSDRCCGSSSVVSHHPSVISHQPSSISHQSSVLCRCAD